MKKVTMQDIADAVGVSKMSVSKCFQGSGDVSPELKSKVLDTAAAMGYVYRKKNIKKIAVLMSERFLDPSDKFYSGILQKLNALSEECAMSFSIQIVSKADEKECHLSAGVEHVEGIMLLGQISREFALCVQRTGIPTVCIDFEWWDIGMDTVVCNNFRASYNMTMYLIRHGHQKIAFVGNLNYTNSIDDRYLGYRKALLQSGIPFHEGYQIDELDGSGEHVFPALPEDMPTAFVCNNDFCAFLLNREMQSAGYRVPEDISIVGFDNMLYSTFSSPEITTMNVPIESLAVRAVKQLGRRIADPHRPVSISNIECSLIERSSVARL